MKKPSDPPRLVDDPTTPGRLGRALALTRGGPDAKALGRLSGALGVAAPLSPPTVPPASGLAAAKGGVGASLGMAGVTVVVAASLGAGAFALSRERPPATVPPAPRASVVAAPTPVAPSPAMEAPIEAETAAEAATDRAPSAPAVPPAVVRRRHAEPGPASAAPAPETTTTEAPPPNPPTDAASRLREEARLVQSAERVLGSDPARALALTQERRQRFPRGALDQEAEVVAIDALLRLGRRDQARARAQRFEASHPGSVHARRIHALVGSNP